MTHRVLAFLCGAVLAASVGCAPGGEDGDGIDCESMCGFEDECGLRSYDDCEAASCLLGFRTPSTSDLCIQTVIAAEGTCADAIGCTCAESCSKIESCTESPDPGCDATCEGIVEQAPTATYLENRCRIETTNCEDLALCGGTSG
jgi:hypothetical protein